MYEYDVWWKVIFFGINNRRTQYFVAPVRQPENVIFRIAQKYLNARPIVRKRLGEPIKIMVQYSGVKPSTLCWNCQRAGGGAKQCSWFESFIPVKGWYTKKTYLTESNGKYENESYTVLACPKFLPEDKKVPQEEILNISSLAHNQRMTMYFEPYDDIKRLSKFNMEDLEKFYNIYKQEENNGK